MIWVLVSVLFYRFFTLVKLLINNNTVLYIRQCYYQMFCHIVTVHMGCMCMCMCVYVYVCVCVCVCKCCVQEW